jgi:hypothetical protein
MERARFPMSFRQRFLFPSMTAVQRCAGATQRNVLGTAGLDPCFGSMPYESAVLNGVPKVTNEVTLGEVWCVSATVSD